MKNGWQTVRLGDVLQRVKAELVIDDSTTYKQVTVRLWNKGVILRGEQEGITIKTKRQFYVKTGQLLLSRIDVRNGAIGLVPKELNGAIISNDFWAYEFDENKLLPKYLAHYITIPIFIEDANRTSSGTTQRIRAEEISFLNIKIPLPPFNEQQRIVEHVEAIVARIAKAQTLRDEASEEARYLHGSFAAKALNDVSSSPKYSIGDICDVRGGIQKQPARLPNEHPTPYLTVAHVQRNHIDISSPTRFFEVSPDELSRWKLEIGDLLIIEGNGSADQIGRTALYRGELGVCVHQNHVIRARPNQQIIFPEYLNIYMNSPLGQDEVQNLSRTTSGLRTLSVGRIREIEIPIPPLEEQRRIVAYLDSLQAKVDELRRLQSESERELSALMPSILDRAFKGEL